MTKPMRLEDRLSVQRYQNRQRLIDVIDNLLSRKDKLDGKAGLEKQALKCLGIISSDDKKYPNIISPDDRKKLEKLIQLDECIIEDQTRSDTSSWRWYCSGKISFNTLEECTEIGKNERIFSEGRSYYEDIFKKRIEKGGGCAGKPKKKLLAEAISNNKGIAERCGLIISDLQKEAIFPEINTPKNFATISINESKNIEDIIKQYEIKFTSRKAFESSLDSQIQNIRDERKKSNRNVIQREGQDEFKEILMNVYGGKCVITKCNVEDTLDAAHILPYKGRNSNSIANGLLLRADIHKLFDCHRIAINPDTYKIVISSSLDNTDYKQFDGKPLGFPKHSDANPSYEALKYKYKLFVEQQT
jgi:predicted restriction endonuclease